MSTCRRANINILEPLQDYGSVVWLSCIFPAKERLMCVVFHFFLLLFGVSVCLYWLTSCFIAQYSTAGGPMIRLSRLYRWWYWGDSKSARTSTVSKAVFSASANSSTVSVIMHGVLMSWGGDSPLTRTPPRTRTTHGSVWNTLVMLELYLFNSQSIWNTISTKKG